MTLIPRNGEESHYPARTREVYDTSGAGDTVIATLAAGLGSGSTMVDAVAIAITHHAHSHHHAAVGALR